MNIKQLNQQGQNIWTFVITALLALILTGLIWVFIAADVHWGQERSKRQHNQAPETRTTTAEGQRPKLQSPKADILTRLGLLKFLLMHRFFRWTWETNAWISILTNDRIGRLFFDKNPPYIGEPEVKSFNELTVCEYVLKHAPTTMPEERWHNWFDHRLFFARREPERDERTYPEIIYQEPGASV